MAHKQNDLAICGFKICDFVWATLYKQKFVFTFLKLKWACGHLFQALINLPVCIDRAFEERSLSWSKPDAITSTTNLYQKHIVGVLLECI